MCAVCAVLGLGHPVLNCVEVLSRWEAVRKGTHELSVDSESCAEDEKGTSHAEGAVASSVLVQPEPGGASRRERAGRGKALFKTDASVTWPFTHLPAHLLSIHATSGSALETCGPE